MIKEAFEPSESCVASQLSAHLEIAEEQPEEHLNGLHDNWGSEGVTPKDLLAPAKLLGRSFYLLGDYRLLMKYKAGGERRLFARTCGGHIMYPFV